jgi:hypothetical protein
MPILLNAKDTQAVLAAPIDASCICPDRVGDVSGGGLGEIQVRGDTP